MPLASNHFPRIVTLADTSLVRITRCDAEAVVFDRVNALEQILVPAQAVPPISGFDPAVAAAWPTDAVLATQIATPPAVPPQPWRVLKDTIWMRAKTAGKQAEAVAVITALPTSQRLDWDAQSWFWSNNDAIRLVCTEMGLDPDVALARDPLAP
jgi:hypothetical protein